MVNIHALRARLESHILQLPGIVFVGTGSQKFIIGVEKEEDIINLPRTIAGYPVEPIVVGDVRILTAVEPMTTRKFSKLFGGASISPPEPIAGTLAFVDYQGLMVSNAHVMAMDYRGKDWYSKGTPIYHPALIDAWARRVRSVEAGHLVRYLPITPNDTFALNVGDLAVAIAKMDYEPMKVGGGIGEIQGIVEPSDGMRVKKFGRTTGLSRAEVIASTGSIKVKGYPWGWAVFRDVFITTSFARPGDSGSAIVHDDKLVGVLFAGSKEITVGCKAKYLYLLGVALSEEMARVHPVEAMGAILPAVIAGGTVIYSETQE